MKFNESICVVTITKTRIYVTHDLLQSISTSVANQLLQRNFGVGLLEMALSLCRGVLFGWFHIEWSVKINGEPSTEPEGCL